MNTYKKLDIKVLQQKSDRTITTNEALKNTTPFSYPQDVINGQKKITIDIRRNEKYV